MKNNGHKSFITPLRAWYIKVSFFIPLLPQCIIHTVLSICHMTCIAHYPSQIASSFNFTSDKRTEKVRLNLSVLKNNYVLHFSVMKRSILRTWFSWDYRFTRIEMSILEVVNRKGFLLANWQQLAWMFFSYLKYFYKFFQVLCWDV